VDDGLVTAAVDGRGFADRKDAAMRSHPTQIMVDGPFFALSNNIGQRAFGYEHYRLIRGGTPPTAGELEEDLFAGVGA
jgi:N-acetyl-1-D-myo-inositol-2-amino-2-deoxy-alpha-D-glucopyranoside deacetylase